MSGIHPARESTIRIGDYKLVRNYAHAHRKQRTKQTRVDIEESHNLARTDPQRAQSMNSRLTEILTE